MQCICKMGINIGEFPHHCYLLLQLFNDTHANLKVDLQTLLKQNQVHVTQSLIQGKKNFPILKIYVHLFKVGILVAKLKNRESDCQCKNACNMSDIFRSSNYFEYHFEFAEKQSLTQIESNDWKSGDRIIWVGSIGLDLDQDSLSESKREMNWLRTFLNSVFFIIWVKSLLGSPWVGHICISLRTPEEKKVFMNIVSPNCSTVSADNNIF